MMQIYNKLYFVIQDPIDKRRYCSATNQHLDNTLLSNSSHKQRTLIFQKNILNILYKEYWIFSFSQ